MSKTDEATQKGVLDGQSKDQALGLTAAEELEAKSQEQVQQQVSYNQTKRDLIAAKRTEELEGKLEEDPAEENKKEGEELIKVKLDGVEEELTQEEFDKKLAEFQKYESADRRLEEASKKTKELEVLAVTLATLQAEINKKEETKVKDDVDGKSTQETEVKIDAAVVAKAIREGEDEDATSQIENLIKSLQANPQITEEAIGKRVQEELKLAKEQAEEATRVATAEAIATEAAQAEENFKEKFKEEIKEDDTFFAIASAQDGKLQKNPDWMDKPLKERYEEAGRLASEWMEVKSKGTVSSLEKKRLLKQNLDKEVSSHSRRAEGDDKNKSSTPSSIIEKIKRARNQRT